MVMETGFLDRLANQLKQNKNAACRRAIQRILVRMKEHCESGHIRARPMLKTTNGADVAVGYDH
jgi:hypothetical protein